MQPIVTMSKKKKENSKRKLTYEKLYEADNDCNYIAFCIDDGVCPYGIKELMNKVRLQAIKDTLEYLNTDNPLPTIDEIDESSI